MIAPAAPILFTAAAVLLLAPGLLAAVGALRAQRAALRTPEVVAPWRHTLGSALCCVLAFNLVFLVQELGLVIPKALTPGLEPVLYHNDHRWQGEHELAHLFQGTGAVATLLLAAICRALLARSAHRGLALRLSLYWLTWCGAMMAMPQLVIGAFNPYNDVGMAMGWFGMGPLARSLLAYAGLLAIPLLALHMLRPLLAMAPAAAAIDSPWGRTRHVLRLGLLPALLAVPAIVLFRIPREPIEVVLLPLIVLLPGLLWQLAGAWTAREVRAIPGHSRGLLLWPALAAALVLVLFQGVLRHGVTINLVAADAVSRIASG